MQCLPTQTFGEGTAMTGSREQSAHHTAAVEHHQQAARFHREAARHYQTGKDYAHAAHQALTAHGHALRALEHGQAASTSYAAHEGSPLPTYLSRSTGESGSTAVNQAPACDTSLPIASGSSKCC